MVVLTRIAEEAEGGVTNWIYRGESAAPSVYGAGSELTARCM